jgi:hypothetical protein
MSYVTCHYATCGVDKVTTIEVGYQHEMLGKELIMFWLCAIYIFGTLWKNILFFWLIVVKTSKGWVKGKCQIIKELTSSKSKVFFNICND